MFDLLNMRVSLTYKKTDRDEPGKLKKLAKMKNFIDANQELLNSGIQTSGILLFQEGLSSEHRSIHVSSIDLRIVYDIAHSNGLVVQLNKLHKGNKSAIILELL